MKQQNTKPDNYNSLFAINFRVLVDGTKDGFQRAGKKKNVRKELAEHCGVSEQSISNWYNGKNEPDPMQRKAVAEYFKLPEDYLFRDHSSIRGVKFVDKRIPDYDDSSAWEALERTAKSEKQLEIIRMVSRFRPDLFSGILDIFSLMISESEMDDYLIEFEGAIVSRNIIVDYLIHQYCSNLETALIDIREELSMK